MESTEKDHSVGRGLTNIAVALLLVGWAWAICWTVVELVK